MVTVASKSASSSETKLRQRWAACIEGVAVGHARLAAQIVDRRLVHGHEAGARARLDAHVADRHAPFHRELSDRLAAVLDHITGATAGAEAPHDREHDVLCRDPRGWRSLDDDRHRLCFLLGQCLGSEDVFDLTGADAKGE